MEEEWSRLQQALTTCFSQGVTFKDGIENQFLNRLIQIITDASAGHGDILPATPMRYVPLTQVVLARRGYPCRRN